MNSDFLNIFILALSYLSLFAFSEFLYQKVKINVELSRKITHIFSGFLALLFPLLLESHWSVLFLSGGFFIILLLSLKFKFLGSINDIKRTSIGSLAFPVAVYGSFLAYQHFEEQMIYFYLPILLLAICDPIAAYVGKRKPFGHYNRSSKTLAGTIGFFIAAFMITVILIVYLTAIENPNHIISFSATIAALCAIVEGFSNKGIDNLTVPATCIACLYFLL